MMGDEFSSDAEEKMMEYDHTDYSEYLKPNPKATIHIGKSFQADLPEINEKKIEKEKKEFEKFLKDTEIKDKVRKREVNSKTKHNKTLEEDDKANHFTKKRKLDEK